MYFVPFILVALQILHSTCACSKYLEQNPALQGYQNASSAFPLQEALHVMYRNYKAEPFFGGTGTCLTFDQSKQGEDGTFPLESKYTPASTPHRRPFIDWYCKRSSARKPLLCSNSTIFSKPEEKEQKKGTVTLTLNSSPGYSLKNIMSFQTQDLDASVQAYTAYRDDKCLISRMPYSDAALQILHSTCACSKYMEQNPALQGYQNASSTFPLVETWHMMYRNYKAEPFFGSTGTCLVYDQSIPEENGVFPLEYKYTPPATTHRRPFIDWYCNRSSAGKPLLCSNSSTFSKPEEKGQKKGTLTLTLNSSPGYTIKNIMTFQTQSLDASVQAYAAYKDDRCLINRTPYSDANACALAVPQSQIGKKYKCCDFVFNLLCGTTEKFTVSDNNCP